ncbi:putative glycoside hydrolase, partial [Pseudonocardia sp. N23]|uniref:putative glycoside hydrolase n=1 Tax=Pseudonocardia sp. N23 TaxID=1987376 RepID=UPI000BFB998D
MRRATVLPLLVMVLALMSCAPAATPAASTRDLPLFPRTATVVLDQNTLPSVDDLARFDLVVIDSEWYGRLGKGFFDDLRSRDPGVIVLAYVNLTDRPVQLGTKEYYADRWSLWRFTDPTTSAFPPEWAARTAAGAPVSEYPNTVMTNLSDQAPRVDGRTFAEYGANWIADNIWSTGVWDGIFLDVWGDTVYSADATAWAVRGDGRDVPDPEIYGPSGPWAAGLLSAEKIMRDRMPGAVLVANGTRSLVDGRLDGLVYESFADPAAGRNPAGDLERYVRETAGDGHRAPGVSLTINADRSTTGEDAARRDRFFLSATLLQNGFWAPATDGYRTQSFPSLLATSDRHYLGTPVVADPTPARLQAPYSDGVGTVAPGVFRRDFSGGVVLHNASGVSREVALGGPFRTQGQAGGTVTAV